MKNLVITLSRQYGSGGLEFAKKLSEALGISYYDKELVKIAADKSNISHDISKQADEKATNSLLYSLATGSNFRGMFNGYYEMPINDKLFIAQTEIIKQLAHQESCVIVGRCSNYVLQNEEGIHKLDLFICADMEHRIERIKAKYELTDAQAKDRIMKTEKKRRTYYNYYSNGNWGLASDYDLCINIGRIGIDTAVRLVKTYVERITELKG